MSRKPIKRLSLEHPTEEELVDFPRLMSEESDRGAAIMGGALVEQALTVAIRSRLADPGSTIVDAWFEGPTAAFGSFAAKITLGRALGIYGEHMADRLSLIKDIRNAFAHRSRPLDFRHEALSLLREKLDPAPERRRGHATRAVFSAACVSVARLLIANAIERGGIEMVVDFP